MAVAARPSLREARRAQPLLDEGSECPRLRTDAAALGVGDRQVQIRQRPVRQQLFDLTAAQFGLEHPLGRDADSQAGKDGFAHALGGAHSQVAVERDGLLVIAATQRPDHPPGRVDVDDGFVSRQVGRFPRLLHLQEIGACAEHDPAGFADPLTRHRRVIAHADAHADIDAFLDQVDRAVLENRIDRERRMGGQEQRQMRNDMESREGDVGAEPQAAG